LITVWKTKDAPAKHQPKDYSISFDLLISLFKTIYFKQFEKALINREYIILRLSKPTALISFYECNATKLFIADYSY
jgi:hypothetical protein